MKFIYKIYIPTNPSIPHVLIRKRITNHFDGFTQYEAKGSWLGLVENVHVYEIITSNHQPNVLQSIKQDMLDAGEEEVLITIDSITTF